jgi:hypothetical protein
MAMHFTNINGTTDGTDKHTRLPYVGLICGVTLAASAAAGLGGWDGDTSYRSSMPQPTGRASGALSRPVPATGTIIYLIDSEEQRDRIQSFVAEQEQADFQEGLQPQPSKNMVFLFARTLKEEQQSADMIELSMSIHGDGMVQVADLRSSRSMEAGREIVPERRISADEGAQLEVPASMLSRALKRASHVAGISPRPGIRPH